MQIADCFLDNFHANKYPEFIAQYNEKNGTDFAVKYAWAEEDLAGGKTNDDWCKEHNVERCATIKEVCEKSDFVMILAPARPDTHLRYCEEAFNLGASAIKFTNLITTNVIGKNNPLKNV